MHTRTGLLIASSICALSGCASVSTPPLFFGELVTFGLDVGATPGSAGADFTLGYRDRNLAIVPVSAINNGKANEIVAWSQEDGSDRRDALSVFGQFKSQAEPSGGQAAQTGSTKVKLGRFFATGLAATNLANGYKRGWTGSSTPPQEAPKTQVAALPQAGATAPGSTNDTKVAPASRPAAAPEASSESHAYAPPLIFGQSNTLGIGVAASVADQGASFTLGYAGRDIAFVPVMARRADGSLTRLGGRDQIGADGKPVKGPEDSREADAFSVFGQFEADTDTSALHYGLNRFFTTGIAARTLTEGFSSAIAADLQAARNANASAGGQ